MNARQYKFAQDDEIVILKQNWRDGVRLPEASPSIISECNESIFTRREALETGVAGVAGVLALTGLPSRFLSSARADPLTFLVSAIFTAAIGWFVRKIMDSTLGDYFDNHAQFRQFQPAPTRGYYPFHDGWGCPFVVVQFNCPCTHIKAHGMYFSFNDYPRANPVCNNRKVPDHYDYNERETIILHAMEKQKQFKAMPYPSTRRMEPDNTDRDMLRTILKKNNYKSVTDLKEEDVDPDEWGVEYTRLFKADSDKEPKVSFGVISKQNTRKKSFIIVEDKPRRKSFVVVQSQLS